MARAIGISFDNSLRDAFVARAAREISTTTTTSAHDASRSSNEIFFLFFFRSREGIIVIRKTFAESVNLAMSRNEDRAYEEKPTLAGFAFSLIDNQRCIFNQRIENCSFNRDCIETVTSNSRENSISQIIPERNGFLEFPCHSVSVPEIRKITIFQARHC